MKILIVDDNTDQALILKELFDAHGFETSVARDGGDAIVRMINDHPDLILLDLLMPKVSGFTFLESKESMPEFQLTPVIILSAWADIYPVLPEDRVVQVLKKDCDFEELLAAVRGYLPKENDPGKES